MANKLIIGSSIPKLAKGYPTYINTDSVTPFTAKERIAFGTFLVATGETKVYTGVQAGSAELTDASKVVGISMATNVKTNTVYPATDSVATEAGETGDCVTAGIIPVTVMTGATAPKEMDPVYIVTVNDADTSLVGTVKASNTAVGAETAILLPNFVFTGVVDGDLACVKKLY